MKAVLLAAAVLCWAAAPVRADDNPIEVATAIYKDVNWIKEDGGDPIAEALSNCLKAHADTRGAALCYDDALKKYDRVLNAVYRAVLARNDKATQEALRQAQRKWLRFHDADRAAQTTYARGGGTMMGRLVAQNVVSAMRQRIAELMLYSGRFEG